MRGKQALVARDIGKHTGGLGHREGQVEPGTPALRIANLLAIGQLALEKVLEGCLVDLASKAKLGRTRAAPGADLAGVLADIIVVLGKVAGRTACGTDWGNRQHRLHPHVHAIVRTDRRRQIVVRR